MKTETIRFISGQLSGQKLALETLIRVLHAEGLLHASQYTSALKASYNAGDADVSRQDFELFRKLALDIDNWVDTQPPFGRRQ